MQVRDKASSSISTKVDAYQNTHLESHSDAFPSEYPMKHRKSVPAFIKASQRRVLLFTPSLMVQLRINAKLEEPASEVGIASFRKIELRTLL